MPFLNELIEDETVEDEEILGGLLNISFSSDDPKLISLTLLQHVIPMVELCEKIPFTRQKIKNVIIALYEIVNETNKHKKFNILVKHLKENRNKVDDTSCVYISCFCRATWESIFEPHIFYKDPKYAVQETMGKEPYQVFLGSLDNDDYVLL